MQPDVPISWEDSSVMLTADYSTLRQVSTASGLVLSHLTELANWLMIFLMACLSKLPTTIHSSDAPFQNWSMRLQIF
jgi:hypothetical protein